MNRPTGDQMKAYDAFDLIKFAWDKKWHLIIASTLAFVLSIIISLQMPEKFESSVVLLPAEKVAASRNMVETSGMKFDGGRGIMGYGDDEDVERILQVLNSTHIRDYIIEKYDLYNHYYINKDKEHAQTKLFEAYQSNIRFKSTPFLGVEITVLDEVPEVAASIANDIAQYIDSTIHRIQRNRTLEGLRLVEVELGVVEEETRFFSDSLQKLQALGVIDYESQVKALNDAYAQALSRGNSQAASSIQRKLNVLAKYGTQYVEVSKRLAASIKRHELLKEKHMLAKVDVEQALPQVYIVDEADVADKKEKPKRMIIVFMSTLSTFVMALLILVIYENTKARF
jgi:tyrosine-protein kinase Etk/Wzc